MKKLFLIGAGGHGKVVADIAEKMDCYETICFLDDVRPSGETCGKWKIVGTTQDGIQHDDGWEFFPAIGNAAARSKITERLEQNHLEIPLLIHPDASIAPDCKIGRGTVIMAGAVINSGSLIGKGVIINTCASADHDNIIGDFSHVAVGAHLAGNVHLGRNVWVGIGAVVSNHLTIADDVVIGAGATVIRDLDEKGTYVGVPAERIKTGLHQMKYVEEVKHEGGGKT